LEHGKYLPMAGSLSESIPTRMGGQVTTQIPDPPRGHAETVLLVDDEAGIRYFAQALLEQHGYQVLAADSGKEALSLLAQRSSEIDVVITDMLMSFIDGATLTRAILKKWPDLPVLLASGGDANDFSDEWKGLKFCGHLQKPYTRHQLLSAVHDALSPATPEDRR
jgi:CheY-like chemotaxis protein